MNDHDLPEVDDRGSSSDPVAAAAREPSHADTSARTSSTVIEFPMHRRGSLADTMRGFPDRGNGPRWKSTRREREVTLVVAELRGHEAIAERLGVPAAAAAVASASSAAVAALRVHGGEQVAVGGRIDRPVIWAEFSGEDHAGFAVSAATALRVEVARAAHGISACTGVNSGRVVDTVVEGAMPVAYRAMGTLRMFAVRLQEFAGPGQVFASASAVAALRPGAAKFRSIGPVRTNAGGETAEAYSLLELSRPAARSSSGASGAAG